MSFLKEKRSPSGLSKVARSSKGKKSPVSDRPPRSITTRGVCEAIGSEKAAEDVAATDDVHEGVVMSVTGLLSNEPAEIDEDATRTTWPTENVNSQDQDS